jgi:hypothetical protein
MSTATVKNLDVRDDDAVVVSWDPSRWGIWVPDAERSFRKIHVYSDAGYPRRIELRVLDSSRHLAFAVGRARTTTVFHVGSDDGGSIDVSPDRPLVWTLDGADAPARASVHLAAHRIRREVDGIYASPDGGDPERAPRPYPRRVSSIVLRHLPPDARTVFTVSRVVTGSSESNLLFAHLCLGGETVRYVRGFQGKSFIERAPEITSEVRQHMRQHEIDAVEKLRRRGEGYWFESGEDLADWFLPRGGSLIWRTDPPTPCTVEFFEAGDDS